MIINNAVFAKEESVTIAKRFKRKCPKNDIYIARLAQELDIIIQKEAVDYLLRVTEVVELLKDIPHIIRGSSGSSLVCYFTLIYNVPQVY